uniref:AlNc14C233G9342 protein n=1 Tax=Albugo laibachii Nc14 TaxID=890382 RepID=F0WSJ7_9STRA|nr:AlNc14C233G9342 [Albugo laibachii Nc14]|eukprot:CCA24323.1 AlNc14C233G9342 [Albugo laibachii Nc14]
MEAILMLEQLRTTSNPGKMWESWKTKMKKQLQAIEKKIAQDSRRDLSLLNVFWRLQQLNIAKTIPMSYGIFLNRVSNNMEVRSKLSPDTTKMKVSIITSCRRVPIENVTKKCGTVTSNPREVVEEFMDHWGAVMGDISSSTNDSADPCFRNQNQLLESIQVSLESEEQDRLSTRLSTPERAEVIKHMQSSSSSGMNGLPVAFYQADLKT